jgi:hypothetical protein
MTASGRYLGEGGTRYLMAEWDGPPPFSGPDEIDYDRTILPAIVRRGQEYLERPGPLLVVRL